MSDCLLNCSNHGECVLNLNGKFVCNCEPNFAGSSCNVDKRICSSQPCMNNGTCEDIIDGQTYSHNCTCAPFYYGTYCQFKEDVCKDEKCSSNGLCVDVQNEPTCKCFQYYSGTKCEIESKRIKTIKTIISTSSILAIIILACFYLTFIISDLCARKRYRIQVRSPKVQKIQKLYYKNKEKAFWLCRNKKLPLLELSIHGCFTHLRIVHPTDRPAWMNHLTNCPL
jgi:hypothetical protein